MLLGLWVSWATSSTFLEQSILPIMVVRDTTTTNMAERLILQQQHSILWNRIERESEQGCFSNL